MYALGGKSAAVREIVEVESAAGGETRASVINRL